MNKMNQKNTTELNGINEIISQYSYPEDFNNGSTLLRFNKLPQIISRSLIVNDPSTYRLGVGYLLKLLVWNNVYERQMTKREEETVEEYTGKIKQILQNYPTFNDQNLPCCWTLIIFKMLGRLHEIDVIPLSNYIKSIQKTNGGFGIDNSSIGKSFDCVMALKTINEKPTNITGLTEYLTKLQYKGNESLWLGFFHPVDVNETGNYRSPDIFSTIEATAIFNTLKIPIPNQEALRENMQNRLVILREKYEETNFEELTTIEDNLYFYQFQYVWSIAVGLNEKDVLDELSLKQWTAYNQLSDSVIEDDEGYIPKTLALLNHSGTKLLYSIAPKKIMISKKDTIYNGVLQVLNPSIYNYTLEIKKIEVTNSEQFSLEIELPVKVNLKKNQFIQLPINFNFDVREKSKIDLLPEKIEIKMEMETIVYGLLYRNDFISAKNATSEVYFEIPLEEKSNKNIIIGVTVGVASVIVIPTIGYHLIKKRKNK
ncbi:MAG: hypothetical protein ACTSQX_04730 [Candidatus Heimdallarchaeota archaeon]